MNFLKIKNENLLYCFHFITNYCHFRIVNEYSRCTNWSALESNCYF